MNETVKDLVIEETVNGAEEAVVEMAKPKFGAGKVALLVLTGAIVVTAAVKVGKKVVANVKAKKLAKQEAETAEVDETKEG